LGAQAEAQVFAAGLHARGFVACHLGGVVDHVHGCVLGVRAKSKVRCGGRGRCGGYRPPAAGTERRCAGAQKALVRSVTDGAACARTLKRSTVSPRRWAWSRRLCAAAADSSTSAAFCCVMRSSCATAPFTWARPSLCSAAAELI